MQIHLLAQHYEQCRTTPIWRATFSTDQSRQTSKLPPVVINFAQPPNKFAEAPMNFGDTPMNLARTPVNFIRPPSTNLGRPSCAGDLSLPHPHQPDEVSSSSSDFRCSRSLDISLSGEAALG